MTHEYTKAGTHTVILKAIKEGEPDKTNTVTLAITVVPAPLDTVVLGLGAPTVKVIEAQQFTATALDQFDNPIPGLTHTFRSAAEAGQVDNQGRFTAGTKTGTYDDAVTVEVTQGSITRSATATVKVVPGPLHHVVVEPESIELSIGGIRAFTAKGYDQFGNELPSLTFEWETTEAVGTVDPGGQFTAGTKAGTFHETLQAKATHNQVTMRGTSDITIRPGPLHKVQLEPMAATLEVTKEQQFTATALDQFGNPIPDLTFAFQSGEQAGQVDTQGRIIAGTKAGVYDDAVTVEVTQGSVSRSTTADVTVTPGPLDHVSLKPAFPTIEVGRPSKSPPPPLTSLITPYRG